MNLIEPRTPESYRVVFSTRVGGVSTGPYASLNLGLLTGDEPERVLENRRRLCESAGADGWSAAMARQVHGAVVQQAGRRGILAPHQHEPCDGLWSDRSGQAMALVTADCFPIAVYRTEGRPALAVLHVGWKGLLAGVAAQGVAALGARSVAAVVGPGIGACCYEVGDEVAARFRGRFGPDLVKGRQLDLRVAAERALREAGCGPVDHVPRCTACEEDSFFSHRRDRGETGRQGVIAYVR